MSERLMNHTWSIRTISPFPKPWDVSNLQKLAMGATDTLRYHVKTLNKVEKEGTYVTINWVELKSRKKHLFFEIYIADEQLSQLVLCVGDEVVTTVPHDEVHVDEGAEAQELPAITLMKSFAFCLVHGDRESYDVILHWIMKTTVSVISSHSFRPTSAQTTRVLHNTIYFLDASKTQLEVTYGTPKSIQNLDQITVSVPSTSLKRFLVDIQLNGKRHRERREEDPPNDNDTPGMVVRALRLLLRDEMKIDVLSLPIVRVANHIVVFGVNGKVRFMSLDYMQEVMNYIHDMMDEATQRWKGKRHKSEVPVTATENGNDDVGNPVTCTNQTSPFLNNVSHVDIDFDDIAI